MVHTADGFSITSQGLSSQGLTWTQGWECLGLLCRSQQHCSFLPAGRKIAPAWCSGCSSCLHTVLGRPMMGTWPSPGELKIDLGHPFGTGARTAHRLPVGEAALIKRTIFEEPGCREGEVIISWWQWLHCRMGLGWVPVLAGRSTQPGKTLLGSGKDWLPSPCLSKKLCYFIITVLYSEM